MSDIMDIASRAGSFNTLVAVVEVAGLSETLRSDGPFTVFAPTDEAFGALPPGTLDQLLSDPQRLLGVLGGHVIRGAVTAGDAGDSGAVLTVSGSDLRVDGREGLSVDGARVILADVEASNGVIHVIDRVLLPAT